AACCTAAKSGRVGGCGRALAVLAALAERMRPGATHSSQDESKPVEWISDEPPLTRRISAAYQGPCHSTSTFAPVRTGAGASLGGRRSDVAGLASAAGATA